jgi:hypothetical protein
LPAKTLGPVLPCPWFSCRWNLALDVTKAGTLVLNHGRTTERIWWANGESGLRNVTRRTHAVKMREANEVGAASFDRFVAHWHEQEATCMLHLIDRHGPYTLADIGEILSITRERIRQIEFLALGRMLFRFPAAPSQ